MNNVINLIKCDKKSVTYSFFNLLTKLSWIVKKFKKRENKTFELVGLGKEGVK